VVDWVTAPLDQLLAHINDTIPRAATDSINVFLTAASIAGVQVGDAFDRFPGLVLIPFA